MQSIGDPRPPRSADVKSAYASAAAILEDLGKLDTRARALVKNDERILASDVIFMDCLQEPAG